MLHWLYKRLPYRLRVFANTFRTVIRLYVFRRPRGWVRPPRAKDFEHAEISKNWKGELQVKVFRGLEPMILQKFHLTKAQFDSLSDEDKTIYRELAKQLIEPEIVDVGHNTVTDAGVAFLASDWVDGSTDITNMNWHAMGTGGSPPSTPPVTATALVTEVETRQAGTKSKPAANKVRTVATITATAARTVNEWGLFSASSGGTMWSTRWFTAISLQSGDAIEFTYEFTLTSFTA